MEVKMYAELVLKKCAVCKCKKPVTDFYIRKISKDGLHRLCKPCEDQRHTEYRARAGIKGKLSDQQKAWRRLHGDRIAKQKRKSKLGVSIEQQEALLREQNCKCAICKAPESTLKRRLALDHDHDTKAIRGFFM